MPSVIPKELREAAKELKGGRDRVDVTVRALVGWFRAERRSPWITIYLRAALRELHLRTEPDFASVNLDATISLMEEGPAAEAGVDRNADTAESPQGGQQDRIPSQDPTLRIRMLRAAISKPVCVNENDPVDKAVTIMLANGYSQLPVMRGEGVKAAISWRSIGTRLSLGSKLNSVSDCLENPLELRADTSLLSAIQQIVSNDYALIKDRAGRLTGIVTTADLSAEFGTLSEPFLLLREIESYLRILLEPVCTVPLLNDLRDPGVERKVATVADLTFGEYVRAFQNPKIWSSLGLRIDKKFFCKALDDARLIRNEVMHFDPDPIELARLDGLRNIVRILQALAESKIISFGERTK